VVAIEEFWTLGLKRSFGLWALDFRLKFDLMLKTLLLSVITGFLMFSCQKQSNSNGNARLSLSADTVSFDTVFTATAAITQQVIVTNNNNQSVNISSLGLAGGPNSPFIINIDGSPGPEASNLSIPANDSLIIFVTVYIPSGSVPVAFGLQDSIRISYNGTEQFIQLTAWGQNAHFLKSQVIGTNTIWPNDLPYVIYGSLTIDSNTSLTIQPGVHIYMHADAPIYVDGTMNVLGDSLSSQHVYFTGDRLDLPYAGYPGSWPGIYFRQTSKDNILNYAVFQNGNHSLVTEGPGGNANPKLSLNQCIINNSLGEGILAIQSSIRAVNCLVSNCGQNIVIGLGGVYDFEYCTIASYSTNLLFHQLPVLNVSNAGSDGNQVLTADLNAAFTNCIFWGSQGVADEALISKQGSTVFNILFDHSILKQQNYPANIDSVGLLLNTDPLFNSATAPFDFQLQAGSPALNIGANKGILIDLNGNPRPPSLSDLGSYERQ
jgi:hypothetical protein